jgi:septum formation topological specificity factor MinE
VAAAKAFGVVPARLELVLANGRTEHIETEDLSTWVEDISDARQLYIDNPRSENEKLFPAP